MKIGDRVKLTKDIWEPASDDAPAGYLGRRGDVVVIRAIVAGAEYPFTVAHDWFVGEGVRGFKVNDQEITDAN